MVGIGAAVSIDQRAVGRHLIFVRTVASFDDRYSRDAQRHLRKDTRFEDALRADQRNALALESESRGQRGARDAAAVALRLDVEETKCLETDEGVDVLRHEAILLYSDVCSAVSAARLTAIAYARDRAREDSA